MVWGLGTGQAVGRTELTGGSFKVFASRARTNALVVIEPVLRPNCGVVAVEAVRGIGGQTLPALGCAGVDSIVLPRVHITQGHGSECNWSGRKIIRVNGVAQAYRYPDCGRAQKKIDSIRISIRCLGSAAHKTGVVPDCKGVGGDKYLESVGQGRGRELRRQGHIE